MAKQLRKIFITGSDEIVQNFTIESWHVSQSVDAFTGQDDYDIITSGSLTLSGSFFQDSIIDAVGVSNTNVVVRNPVNGEYFITGSYFGAAPQGAQGDG